MWHPQSDEAHGEQPTSRSWLVPWVYPITLIAVMLLIGAFLLGRPSPADSYSGDGRIVAGALRWTGDGWRVIDDDRHDAVGIASLDWNRETRVLTVRYTFTANATVSFVAVTDETMAAAGYHLGASVARHEARIAVVGDAPLATSANIWVYGYFH